MKSKNATSGVRYMCYICFESYPRRFYARRFWPWRDLSAVHGIRASRNSLEDDQDRPAIERAAYRAARPISSCGRERTEYYCSVLRKSASGLLDERPPRHDLDRPTRTVHRPSAAIRYLSRQRDDGRGFGRLLADH